MESSETLSTLQVSALQTYLLQEVMKNVIT